MVASVPEIQSAGNQKQCFDMLIVRLMHIADMPSVPELLKRNPETLKPTPVQPAAKNTTININNAEDLANALKSSKEILLYSYYTSNIEIAEITSGHIKYFDRKGDADFAQKLSAWLNDKTGNPWTLERVTESQHTHTLTEQKQEELESDPLVASAMDLFADAEIVGVK